MVFAQGRAFISEDEAKGGMIPLLLFKERAVKIGRSALFALGVLGAQHREKEVGGMI